MMGLGKFWAELKRRKVIRVAITYFLVAWIIVEVASVMFPGMLLPDWSVRLVIGLAILGFPIALVLAWAVDVTPQGIQKDPGNADDTAPPGQRTAREEEAKEKFDSVAVLPFVNLSNDPDNEYFSDGMSEELLNLLCKLPQLTVASRTSSFSFKGKDTDMATIARQLGVDVIIEGSVRRSGERVRITAQLIDARRDRHLWSETFDRDLRDVFAVQDEIAGNVVRALELSLTPEQQKSIRKEASTEDMEAYEFYLRGRYFVERGETGHGLLMFEKAMKLDENYALAWAGAADCHSWTAQWIGRNDKSLNLADEYSLKALSLAPDLAEAHASRSFALTLNGRFEEAQEEAGKAIDLDPRLYEAYYYQGRAYFAQGRHPEAFEAFKKALRVRPDDLASSTLMATAIKNYGSDEECREFSQAAIVVAERYLALNPDDALAISRAANDYLYLGDRDKALEMAERAYSINPQVCRYNVACTFVLLGQIERAIDILEEHARLGSLQLGWVEHDSDLDAARDHPRFQAIIRELKGENRG